MTRTGRRRLIAVALVAALIVGVLLVRAALGEKVPGYRIEARPLTQNVVATGRLISVSRVQVGSEITGVVVERRVEEGDAVSAGDVLVVLRADDLEAQVREAEAALAQLRRATRPQAQVAQREAEAELAQAERELTRRQDLFARKLIAREALEQAEEAVTNARAAVETARLGAAALASGGSEEALLLERLAAARAGLEKAVVRSQVDGVVLTRNAEPGDLVQPGTVLFNIARSGDTEVLVPFDEENLSVLRVGQNAVCIADAFPSQHFDAVITLISPRVDPERGTVDVRLRVDPVPEFARQDMTVSVNVRTGHRDRALVVPNDALLNVEADRAYVWTVRDNTAQRVPIALGLRGVTLSEVVSGLAAGDRVILSGTVVEEGARVRVVEQPLPAAGPSDPPAAIDSRRE
jgi:HlyD family secretion protein